MDSVQKTWKHKNPFWRVLELFQQYTAFRAFTTLHFLCNPFWPSCLVVVMLLEQIWVFVVNIGLLISAEKAHKKLLIHFGSKTIFTNQGIWSWIFMFMLKCLIQQGLHYYSMYLRCCLTILERKTNLLKANMGCFVEKLIQFPHGKVKSSETLKLWSSYFYARDKPTFRKY